MFRLLGLLLTVLYAITAAVVVWPQFFRLEQTFPFAQLVASRGVLLIAFAAVGLLSLLLMIARPLRGFAASLLVISILAGGAIGVIGGFRGVSEGSLPAKTENSVRVMTWNTRGEAASADTIAREAVAQKADIVTLPETADGVGERIAVLMRESGRPMWVHNVNIRPDVKNGPQAWQTTVLISPKLGDYSVIKSSSDGSSNTKSVPSVVAMPVDGHGPTVVAVHAVAPRQNAMERWRTDLQWIADQCPKGDFILAGEFNATIDHMARLGVDGGDMGRCQDVATRTGTGMWGTWPSNIPGLLSAPIDHIMASANWTPTGSLVIDDAAGSDHRALVAQLDPTR
ncbi:MAG: endonuclease/exonuclease/phosphatase family protein [Microbacterium sp.]|jgi:endonuclease/exonuclease/phosphatase (EEP) superfamily protein YafD|nr:endonuclease/exonuclease/phosphatase family protein [Microbacterium sp.]